MQTQVFVSGLAFGEGPRWHEDELWLSDMHAHQVLRVSTAGEVNAVVEVEQAPSGLGWLPGGDLLIVSMTDRRILRWDGNTLAQHCDLSDLTRYHINDMVVDSTGRAYVGNFGFDLHGGATPAPAELICVEPGGSARIVAEDLMFPNGTVITPDGSTLIVAESFASRLTAFDISANGDLTNRRIWAELPDSAVPDGICLDAGGGIWSASPTTSNCIRQTEGGEVTHQLQLDQGAFACMLGGPDGDTLYVLSAPASDPEQCIALKGGRIDSCTAPYPRAGYP